MPPVQPRKGKQTRAQKREEVRVKLLGAVERLLAPADASYTELSVERLVTEAGVSRSTFYVYFEDKGDLLVSLAAGVIDDLNETASGWWGLGPEATRDDLATAMRNIVESYVPHRVVMAAFTSANSHDARVREQFTTLVLTSVEGLAAYVRRGQAEGVVRPGLDPERTAGWLTWMTERGLEQLVSGADEAERAALTDALTGIVWNALYVAAG